MASFKIGDEVRQKITPIQGTVLKREISGDDDIYLVKWVDADGNEQETFLSEETIELVL